MDLSNVVKRDGLNPLVSQSQHSPVRPSERAKRQLAAVAQGQVTRSQPAASPRLPDHSPHPFGQYTNRTAGGMAAHRDLDPRLDDQVRLQTFVRGLAGFRETYHHSGQAVATNELDVRLWQRSAHS